MSSTILGMYDIGFSLLGQSLQLLHELAVAACTDSLTGMRNRRFFDQRKGSQEITSVIVLDIDHFKQINDTCGHDAGDKIIANVASVIMSVVREGDCCRYGGDEFVVLMGGPNPEQVAKRILCAVTEQTQVTVSIGVGSSFSGADSALYEAKRNGRNQVRTTTDW